MKKIIAIITSCLLLAAITGCGGKPKNVRDGIYNVAVESLDKCDQFLDGKMELSDVGGYVLDSYKRLVDLYGYSGQNDTEEDILDELFDLSGVCVYADLAVLLNERELSDTYAEVLESRNALAKTINAKSRT
ncbi:MAG: hypothetical protein LBQ91_04885 [Oscillospiraceae bacterium]|jgi:hypothetical protein|nr:hypothetical protein [Oscillospiraceae bacterium]